MTNFANGSYKIADLLEAGTGVINGKNFAVVKDSKKSKFGTGKKTVISIEIDGKMYNDVAIDVIKKTFETPVNGRKHRNGRTKIYTKINILNVLNWAVTHPQQAKKVVDSLKEKEEVKVLKNMEVENSITELYKQIALLKAQIK